MNMFWLIVEKLSLSVLLIIISHEIGHFLVAKIMGFQRVKFVIDKKDSLIGIDVPWIKITWSNEPTDKQLTWFGISGFAGTLICMFLTVLYCEIGVYEDWIYTLCLLFTFTVYFITYPWRHAGLESNDFNKLL